MKKYLVQIIIGCCLYLLIPLLSNNDNISEIIKYLIGAIPVLYSLTLFTYYKPKNYLKFLNFNSRNRDVGYSYNISIKEYDMDKVSFDRIKGSIYEMERNEIHKPNTMKYNCGLYKFVTVFNNGFFNVEMDYSVEEKLFKFECKSTTTYKKLMKRLFKINEKLLQSLNLAEAEYEIKMDFEFLVDSQEKESKEPRNPFVQNIFKEFQNRNLHFSYTAKQGTKIEISNNRLCFISNSLDSINRDIRNETSWIKY